LSQSLTKGTGSIDSTLVDGCIEGVQITELDLVITILLFLVTKHSETASSKGTMFLGKIGSTAAVALGYARALAEYRVQGASAKRIEHDLRLSRACESDPRGASQ
jgi:hypothetical protein